MTKKLTVAYKNLSDNFCEGGMGWLNELDKAEKSGAVLPTLPNARRIISYHPYLNECFAWSELDEDIMLMRPLPSYSMEGLLPPDPHGKYPQRYGDKFSGYLRDILCVFATANFKAADIDTAVKNVALQNSYNPIREYLNSLKWDGKHRLTEWLSQALDAENNGLNSSIGFMFLIAACRRACFKRYKFDSLLILEGEKGIRKSTACRVLFGDEYFSEGIGDIRKDECVRNLAGMWGAEIPEGKGFFTASAEEQKEFLSKVDDVYRRPYERRGTTVARKFVLICTTNASEYITENGVDRRYWTVKCGRNTNLDWLIENRDQLWAEAYHYAMMQEADGSLTHKTYMEEKQIEELGTIQLDRVIGNPWEMRVRFWLEHAGQGVTELSPLRIMSEILDIPSDRQDRSTATKVGVIMKDLGWRKRRVRSGMAREQVYERF